MTLIEFLRARLDEDERLASWSTHTHWTATRGEYGPKVNPGPSPTEEWSREVNVQVWQCDDEQDGCPDIARAWMAEAKHIARHNPARVLAEVEAKRRLVDAHEPDANGDCTTCLEGESDVHGRMYERAPCWHLRVLALPYADHPDYDESWKP